MKAPRSITRRGAAILLFAAASALGAADAAVTPRANSRVCVFGDSIVALGSYATLVTPWPIYYRGGSSTRGPYQSAPPTPLPSLPSYIPAGVSGNKAADLDARVVTDVVNLAPKPTIVLVAGGTNDAQVTAGPAFTASYSSVLTKLIAGGILPANIGCVSVMFVGSEANPGLIDPQIDATNVRIQACCAAVGGTYIDVRTPALAYEVVNNPGNLTSGVLTTDGTHLTATGMLFLSNTVRAVGFTAPEPL